MRTFYYTVLPNFFFFFTFYFLFKLYSHFNRYLLNKCLSTLSTARLRPEDKVNLSHFDMLKVLGTGGKLRKYSCSFLCSTLNSLLFFQPMELCFWYAKLVAVTTDNSMRWKCWRKQQSFRRKRLPNTQKPSDRYIFIFSFYYYDLVHFILQCVSNFQLVQLV